jgi:hypothetical protein
MGFEPQITEVLCSSNKKCSIIWNISTSVTDRGWG